MAKISNDTIATAAATLALAHVNYATAGAKKNSSTYKDIKKSILKMVDEYADELETRFNDFPPSRS